MTDQSREHFMADFGAVIQNPIPVGDDPQKCRVCPGTLGKTENGKARCKKCDKTHGFLVINGKIRYGICIGER